MEIKATFPVQFDKGIGYLRFPANLKRSPDTTVGCYNLHVEGVTLGVGDEAEDQQPTSSFEGVCLQCDSSYYRDENFTKQLNTLAIFPLSPTAQHYSFYNPPLPLTVTPEIIYFRIVDLKGEVKEISATALIHIDGTCQERVRHI